MDTARTDALTAYEHGQAVRLANGAKGTVFRYYPEWGTVRVLYRLGSVELDGLFRPDELTPEPAQAREEPGTPANLLGAYVEEGAAMVCPEGRARPDSNLPRR